MEKPEDIESGDKHQFYGQLIVNTLYDKKLGIGIGSFLFV